MIDIQLNRFREMLGPVFKLNAFYKNKFEVCGLSNPNDIQTLSDYQ